MQCDNRKVPKEKKKNWDVGRHDDKSPHVK